MNRIAIEIPQESNRIYFPELDGLRFLAFLLVFIHHQELFSKIPWLSFLHTRGWIGVDLFFVLSAFLLTKLLSVEFERSGTISVGRFYIRRILRIWPLYFLFVAVAIALYLFHKHEFPSEIVIRIVGLFTFTDNILAALEGFNPLPFAGHLWTIAYEEQFYLFLPWVVLWLKQVEMPRRILVLVMVLIVLAFIRLTFIMNDVPLPAIWVLPVTHFESIVLGIALGLGGMKVLVRTVSPVVAGCISLIAFVLICLLPPTDIIGHSLSWTYAFVGVSTSMLLYAVSHSDVLKKIFSYRLLVFLGKRSYGLYVFHGLATGAATYISYFPNVPRGPFAVFIYALLFTIVAAVVSYRFIETPFLKWKRKFEAVESRPV